jgi:hypothetical protein
MEIVRCAQDDDDVVDHRTLCAAAEPFRLKSGTKQTREGEKKNASRSLK